MPDAQRQATLLFVDDEPSILAALNRLFRPLGYRILTADSGAAGLGILEREAVDLVVSDMRMPMMDGAQFLERVCRQWPRVMRILLTGYSDVAATIAAINRSEIYRYIAKPWNDEEILLTVRDALERQRLEAENARLNELTLRQNEELKSLNASLEQKVAERTVQLKETLTSLELAHKALKKGFFNSVRVFSGLIELRGGHLGSGFVGHSRRVAELAHAVAKRLNLDDSDVQDVMLAGLLHDIGKLGLPDELLDRPFNGLPPDARAEVMKHPVIGQNVLIAIDQLKNAAVLVRHHHECFDGTGFPDQLEGAKIPLGSRILAAVNDYDALQLGTLTQRPQKPADALAYLLGNRQKRYDPTVVDALAQIAEEIRIASIDEKPLLSAQLQPGMVLARDLVHRDGYLLLAQNHMLDAVIIGYLKRIEENDGQAMTIYVRRERMAG